MNKDIINDKSIEVVNKLRSEGLETPEIVDVLEKALSIHRVVNRRELLLFKRWLSENEKGIYLYTDEFVVNTYLKK